MYICRKLPKLICLNNFTINNFFWILVLKAKEFSLLIAVFPNGSPFRILCLQRRLFSQIGLLLVTFFEKRSPK